MESYFLQSDGDIAHKTAAPPALFAPEISPSPADEEPAPLLSIVRLLDKAGEALGSDRGEVHHYIQKAAALLRVQSEAKDGQGGRARGTPRCRLAPWQVNRATHFIDANLGRKISIRNIAETTRLSSSHFSRAFRSTVGVSPHAYIIRRRIERAQHLIRSANTPLSEIALDCGFSDQAHLTKLFRRVVGISPGAWRRAHGTTNRQLAA